MQPDSTALDPHQAQLLAETAEWRLLGLLFEYPSQDWRQNLLALKAETPDPRLQLAAQTAVEEASEGMYHSLFGPGGPVPLREAAYRGSLHLGYMMSEVGAFYDAFGFRPQTPEATDHLSVMIGFMAFMKLKLAYAAACGDSEEFSITEDAIKTFRKDHLAVMAHPVARSTAEFAPAYVVAAASILAERVGPPPRAPEGPAPFTGDADSDLFCGDPPAEPSDLIQLEPLP